MRFAKILSPTDFSDGAQRALEIAARLATDRRTEIVVAHAWYLPANAYSLDGMMPMDLDQSIIDDANRGLQEAVKSASAAGARHVNSKLFGGVPWNEIVKELEHETYDLCVMGTHGRTGLSRVLLGSVAEKVVRHAHCSVMVVRPSNTPGPLKHVLVPTDFTTNADQAMSIATQIVHPEGKITLLHVIEVPVSFAGEVTPDVSSVADKKATALLARTAEKLRISTPATLETRSRLGTPGAQTLAAIEADATIDLVVMGSHGRTGIKRALLGSVAEKVVRHARCPVLVARARP